MAENKEQKIESLISRNVEEVIESDHLRAALLSGKKLRIKFGIDPTSPDLHLGHAVILRKLRAFQDAGHIIVLVIGDFTARIGDPSGRSETRKPLSEEAIKENMKEYLAQAKIILDIKKAEVAYNSTWFAKEGIEQFVQLAMSGTFQQVIRRADFKKRIDDDQDITFLELLYPLFQGYDSVKVKADVEVGGTDQKFNLLTGRRVQRHFDIPEQDVMTFPLLEGLDGVKKMSKSLGNYIGLTDAPEDMFGKVMSIPDALVEKYFLLCTDVTEDEIKSFKKTLGPKELKEQLGLEIIKIYHDASAAQKAQENFEKMFSRHEMPEDLPELNLVSVAKLADGKSTALDIVMAAGEMKSRGEARRLIEGGGFEFAEKVIKNPLEEVAIRGGEIVRMGKKRYFRVTK